LPHDFPIDPKWKDRSSEEDGAEEPVIMKELASLVRHVHGSLEPKSKLIEDFSEKHPDCSRNAIEKKLK
jgi:hypothetical protein